MNKTEHQINLNKARIMHKLNILEEGSGDDEYLQETKKELIKLIMETDKLIQESESQ